MRACLHICLFLAFRAFFAGAAGNAGKRPFCDLLADAHGMFAAPSACDTDHHHCNGGRSAARGKQIADYVRVAAAGRK